jgi:hypothetical protein
MVDCSGRPIFYELTNNDKNNELTTLRMGWEEEREEWPTAWISFVHGFNESRAIGRYDIF